MKLMVVDDVMVVREQIQNVLKSESFEIVGTAQNGVEAVQQFKALKPRVMTLDITMPLMNGIETIRRIKALDKDVRILVVSGSADKETLIKAMRVGACGFLVKPFADAELVDAMEELVEGLA